MAEKEYYKHVCKVVQTKKGSTFFNVEKTTIKITEKPIKWFSTTYPVYEEMGTEVVFTGDISDCKAFMDLDYVGKIKFK